MAHFVVSKKLCVNACPHQATPEEGIYRIFLFLFSMAFTPYTGDWKSQYIPTKASTTYTAGMILYNDGTDNVVATTSSTANWCIAAQDKASAANTNSIKVWVPASPNCTFLGDVGSGTPAVANFGATCDIASGGLTSAEGTDTHHQLIKDKYISATVRAYKFNNRPVAS